MHTKTIRGVKVVFRSDPVKTAKRCIAMLDRLRLARCGGEALPAPELFQMPMEERMEKAQQ